VLDTDWIPEVAARGWLIITRDSMIAQNRNEVAAVRENKARMVALNQRDAQTKWGQLEVFMTQWRSIEAVISEPGPFIWRASHGNDQDLSQLTLLPSHPSRVVRARNPLCVRGYRMFYPGHGQLVIFDDNEGDRHERN
jgi:hypothetical protein